MASGDKFYIADKATLDEVKGVIGNTTDTGGSSTAGTMMAKENAILGEVGKLGATNDAQSSSTTTGSIFAKLNYLVSQISLYLSNIFTRLGAQADSNDIGSKSSSAHGKLNWFIDLFGKTDDTNGSMTEGSVMGKLNAILKQPKQYAMKTLSWTMVANEIYEVTVQGKGVFYGIYSSVAQNINGASSYMTIDGITYNIPAGDSTTSVLNFQPKSTGYGLYWSNYGATSGVASAKPDEYGYLEFSQGFTIQIKTTTAYPFVLHYSILE